MSRLSKSIAIVAFLLSVSHSFGQIVAERGAAIPLNDVMYGFQLLKRPDVRAGIGLTASQLKKYKQFAPRVYAPISSQTQGAAAMAAARTIRDALSSAQRARLKQIAYQAQGAFALSSDVIAKEVGLADAQKKKIYGVRVHGLSKFQAEQKREGKAYKPNPATTRWILTNIEAVLTPSQHKKWLGILGRPFKFNPPIR